MVLIHKQRKWAEALQQRAPDEAAEGGRGGNGPQKRLLPALAQPASFILDARAVDSEGPDGRAGALQSHGERLSVRFARDAVGEVK